MSQPDPDPTPQNPYLPGTPQAGPPAGPSGHPPHPFPAAPASGPVVPGSPWPVAGPYAGAPVPWGPGPVPWSPPPEHPQATTALVLGVVAIMGFLPTGPFAWVIGGRARRAIDADPARWGGRGLATAGYVLGIVTTVMLALLVGVIALTVGVAVGD